MEAKRTPGQIRVDELIKHYTWRSKEVEVMAKRFETDRELLKQMTVWLDDLKEIKKLIAGD